MKGSRLSAQTNSPHPKTILLHSKFVFKLINSLDDRRRQLSSDHSVAMESPSYELEIQESTRSKGHVSGETNLVHRQRREESGKHPSNSSYDEDVIARFGKKQQLKVVETSLNFDDHHPNTCT